MKAAGIIAEYNPFHNGHKYQIEKTREAGATHIVCVMSGDCVQRGDLAIYSKHVRAREAVKNGADLVIELPFPYCMGTAPDFARTAVGILSRLGCIDILSFGAETDDLALLTEAADYISSNSTDEISEYLSNGLTYPQAICKAAGNRIGTVLSGANNTLAIEYIKALGDSNILPFAVKRTVSHDGDTTCGSFASASKIRELLLQGNSAGEYLPSELDALPSNIRNVESALLLSLSMLTEQAFALAPYTGDGIAQRLYSATRRSDSLEEIYSLVKTKNVTHARVRRATLLSALGVTAEDIRTPCPYARLLALNERGAELLSVCKKASSIPISASLSDLSKQNEQAARIARLDEVCSRLRSLAAGERNKKSEYSQKFSIQ